MKYVMIISFLFISACNKPKCWTCTIDVKSYAGGISKTFTVDYCDKTRKEIQKLEKEMTLDNGLEKQTTNCKAK